MGLLERLRAQPGWKDPDPKVRRAAVRALNDPALLAEVARTDADDVVRDEAAEALLEIALEADDETAGRTAVAALGDPKHLLGVARSAALEAVARAALVRLADPRALGSVARHGTHAGIRLEALARIADAAEIASVALKSAHKDAALAALERVALGPLAGDLDASDPGFLSSVAEHAKCPAASHRARVLLHERAAAARAGGTPEIDETGRRKQIRLCEDVEALVRSLECEPLAARIAAAKDAWTDLLPNVEDELHERFMTAIQAARAHLARNQAGRAERQSRETIELALREKHLAPRLTLCAEVERAQGEEAPRALDDACWEWERLPPVDAADEAILAEASRLALRFQEACAECRARHERWEKEQAEARLSAREAADREERARRRRVEAERQRDNAARLRKLCDRGERVVASETLPLKKADPALREIRAALDDPPPLPSRRDRHEILERLKAIQAALAPRVKELRDSEKWERWANANVQEDLCARAEALRAIADPIEVARRLSELQEHWKKASVVPQGKSQALWLRFKTAGDEVRARLEAHQAEQASKKQALCEQVESLASSTDWLKTSESIKKLQAEWKGIGGAGRAQDRVLWERFRKGCDLFFSRRDEDRGRRREEWAKNLERKEGLVAQAEALAGSTEWKSAADEIKRLQGAWKAIGPIRRGRADALWAQFHGACDRFFERYKRRDQIDLEIALAAREAILGEIGTILPAASPPTEPARPEPPGASPPAASPLEALRSARRRWQQSAALPPDRAADLEERFDRAVARAIESDPAIAREPEFDAEANRRKMDDLCIRVERLLPAGDAAAGLSPAARLATLWREALASNTIGGKAAEEARWRSAAEEARKARAAWDKIGHVPSALRRPLTERFESACRRISEAASKAAPATPKPGGPDRKRARPHDPRRRAASS